VRASDWTPEIGRALGWGARLKRWRDHGRMEHVVRIRTPDMLPRFQRWEIRLTEGVLLEHGAPAAWAPIQRVARFVEAEVEARHWFGVDP
jgi:hypothetical protein